MVGSYQNIFVAGKFAALASPIASSNGTSCGAGSPSTGGISEPANSQGWVYFLHFFC